VVNLKYGIGLALGAALEVSRIIDVRELIAKSPCVNHQPRVAMTILVVFAADGDVKLESTLFNSADASLAIQIFWQPYLPLASNETSERLRNGGRRIQRNVKNE